MPLAKLPRLKLISTPSPLSSLPELAKELGVETFHVKRDDLLPVFFGGSKVRKLDYLLATEPYASSKALVGIGAIGSGLLVALSSAAAYLRKPLHVHCFHEAIDPQVLDNLAFIASRAEQIHFYGSRMSMALARPRLFTGPLLDGNAIVPPGATNVAGMGGIVAASLELAEQIKKGELPAPQRVYVALGSGGTAVGLSVGLALAGIRAELHAVTAIEKPFSRQPYLQKLSTELIAWLTRHGVSGISGLRPLPISLDRNALGPGYGIPTVDSLAACDRLRRHGIQLEPIYSGKAMAALLQGFSSQAATSNKSLKHVLFWQTNRGAGPRIDKPWFDRLPPDLKNEMRL